MEVGVSKPKEVLDAICSRVHANVNSTLSQSLCLQLSIASTMRAGDDVVAFLLPYQQSSLVKSKTEALAMDKEEWTVLFGSSISCIANAAMQEFVATQEFEAEQSLIQDALSLTILESEQQALFAKPFHRIVVYVCFHLTFYEEALRASLGALIKADERKMDDLVDEMDSGEGGVAVLTLCRALELMCSAVCKSVGTPVLT